MSEKDDSLLPSFERQLTTRSDVQDIIFHLQEKEGYEILSEALQKKLDRMRQCRDWIRKHKTRVKVVPMIATEFSVSESTARRLYDETVDVYNVFSEPKGRDLHIDNLLDEYWDLYNKCKRALQFKSAENCLRRIKEIYIDFYGEHDARLYEKLQQHTYILGWFPELSKVELPPPDELDMQVQKLLDDKKKKALSFDEFVDEDITEENDDNNEPTE